MVDRSGPGVQTVRYGDERSQFVEVWEPDGSPVATAVLIHGGYWRDRYGLDLMHPMAGHLRGLGRRVVNIEYRRLAEPGPGGGDGPGPGLWPEMSADVLAAIDAVPHHGESPTVVIGHSAGGHLALWAGANRPGLAGIVALAPVADLVAADRLDLSQGVVRQLLGGDSTTLMNAYRSASPAAQVPLGLPQLVVHGSIDDAVPQQISVDYAAAAVAVGDAVDLLTPEGVDHFHIIDPAHPIWRQIDRWLDRLITGSKPEGTSG